MEVKALRLTIDKKKPFPRNNWESKGWTVFHVEVDGDNIVVDGYSMPVKKDREFAVSCKKTFIKAQGGAEGLYKCIDSWKGWNCHADEVCSWIVTFGKRKREENGNPEGWREA